jgi:protein-S-isoprenylcysteine O-methyltransferase Ste14
LSVAPDRTAATGTPAPAGAPAWARTLRAVADHLSRDFLGGPRPWKLAWIVNAQKAGTFLAIGLMMAWYDNDSTAAWIYLALHGSYGLAWIIKDLAFPDPAWQARVTIGGGINAFVLVLGWYWFIGWMLVSGFSRPDYPLPDNAWYCLGISACILGCTIMVAADAQKYFTLRLRPGLIRDGMFRYVRHPNYLGEILVYASFALLVWHWLAWAILLAVWLLVFAPNMAMKEASLARHPGWAEYRRGSGWLLPRLF